MDGSVLMQKPTVFGGVSRSETPQIKIRMDADFDQLSHAPPAVGDVLPPSYERLSRGLPPGTVAPIIAIAGVCARPFAVSVIKSLKTVSK